MACKRRLYGDLGSFRIADFTDHDHIRVLTHNRSEAVREREADLGFNLDLVYTAQLVLDRVFDGNNFLARIVDLLKRTVKRRRKINDPGKKIITIEDPVE